MSEGREETESRGRNQCPSLLLLLLCISIIIVGSDWGKKNSKDCYSRSKCLESAKLEK